MALFDNFFGGPSWFQGAGGNTQGGLYTPEDFQRARTNLLLGIGANLLAAGQPMSGAQRGQLLSQAMNPLQNYRDDLMAGAKEREMARGIEQRNRWNQYISDPANLEGMPESMRNMLPYMTDAMAGDVTTDWLKSQWGGEQRAPNLVTLISPDGKHQATFNINDPAHYAKANELMTRAENPWTERQSSAVTVNTGDYKEGQAKSTILYSSMSNASKKLDQNDTALTEKGSAFLTKYGGDLGGYFASNEYKTARQAQVEWLQAINYLRSGANIAPIELAYADQTFFPQPGDESVPGLVEQKRQARKVAEQAILSTLGPGQKLFPPQDSDTGTGTAGTAPEGVEQSVWDAMTPEERKLWQN